MTKTAHGALRVAVLVPCVVLLLAGAAAAQDWPSWRGRLQTGVSDQTGLVSSWSVDGENLIWFQEYIARSTPAVFDGRVCANGRTGDGVEKKEIVTCWNAENGSKLWEHTFSVLNTTVPFNRVGWGSVTGDPETGHLYALNVDGHLHCFDRDGDIVWSWRLAEDLGRASGYGGRTSTPIIDEDRLILSVIGSAWGSLGGPPRHRYVAFDKLTGRVRWVSTPGGQPADMNTQSVPIVAVVDGRRLIIDGNADGHVYAMQARTGVKVWEFHLSQRGINVSPVIDGTTVYIAHSEENIDRGTMGRVVAIDATGSGDITSTGELWRIDDLAVGFPSPLIHDGTLYVIDNSANLVAVDAGNGEVQWEYSIGNVGKSSPVWADGKLYLTETNGNVHILRPGPDGPTRSRSRRARCGRRPVRRDLRLVRSCVRAALRHRRVGHLLHRRSERAVLRDPGRQSRPRRRDRADRHGGEPAGGAGRGDRSRRRDHQLPPAGVRRERAAGVRPERFLDRRRPDRIAAARQRRVPIESAVHQPGRTGGGENRRRLCRGPRARILAAALDREFRERTSAALDRRRRQPGRGRAGRRSGLPQGRVTDRHPPACHLRRSFVPVELHGGRPT